MFSFLNYRLDSPELEEAFRKHRLATHRWQLLTLYGMAIVPMCAFLFLDYFYIEDPSTQATVLSMRIGAIATLLIGIIALRKIGDVLTFDRIALLVELLVIAHVVAVNDLLHADPISIAAWDIAVIFVLYIGVPIRISYQHIAAWTLTVGSMIVWIHHQVPQLGFVEMITTPMAYLAANVFGAFFKIHHNRVARHEFALLLIEKKLKSEHAQTLEKLKVSSQTQSQLFSILGHDLRGTIGALGSIGKILATDSNRSEEDKQNLIQLLCEGATASYDVLDNLLHWARSETGDLKPSLQVVDLQRSVASTFEFLSAPALNKDITLVNEAPPSSNAIADPKMLDTVLRNLISNAIKFSNPGGAIIVSHRQAENGDSIISVKDQGVGIKKEKMDRIFELEYGDSEHGTAGEKGSNLGLRICAKFIRMQGGEIWVESEPGQGAQFNFTLPAAPKAETEQK